MSSVGLWEPDADSMKALRYEAATDLDEIDEMRDALLTGWAVMAAEGLQRQAAITDGVDPRTKPLALGINSHFARSVLATLPEAFEEPETLDDLVWGFPGVGALPALHTHAHALSPQCELLPCADLDATLQ